MTAQQGASRPRGRISANRLLCSLLLLSSLAPFAAAGTPDVSQRERMARMQVPFVENCGQLDNEVAFSAQSFSGGVFVTRDGMLVYSLPKGESSDWTLTETLLSGKPAPFAGSRAAAGVSYFHGSDPTLWRSDLPTYDDVHLGEVWRGISVSLRAHGGDVEKVFTVRPGARVEMIRVLVEGARSLRVDGNGALVAETGNGPVRFSVPAAFQERDGARRPVAAAYVLHGKSYGFRLGVYDEALPVVIDPILQSTYLGGSDLESIDANTITFLPLTGEVLVAGSTYSGNFPGTMGGEQPNLNGVVDGFVARLDPALTTLLQATYLGGSASDVITGITIHPTSSEVLVTGYTYSMDFPGTAGGAQPNFGGGNSDGFVTRLDASLTTLVQSTYLGGSDWDQIVTLAVQPSTGELLVAGHTFSTDFPATTGGAQATNAGGEADGFVARLDPALVTLFQSSYLGGSNLDRIWAATVDSSTGQVLVAGDTSSSDFPGTAGGIQPALNGNGDAFVARFDASLTVLLQSTYLGGSAGAEIFALQLLPSTGEVLVAGAAGSTGFPGTAGGAQPLGGGLIDGFVARLNPELTSLLQATYLGGSGWDAAHVLAVDPATGNILVAGFTYSIDFPQTTGGAQPSLGGGEYDGFVARFDSTLTTLVQATYLGGSQHDRVDALGVNLSTGEVLAAGMTSSADFPGTAGGAQPVPGGFGDAFVARLSPDLLAILAPAGLSVDPLPNPGDGDFLIEPAEEALVIPSWKNQSTDPVSANGKASEFTGPAGADYTIVSDTVSYGTIAPGTIGPASGSYRMFVNQPSYRPAFHWDASFLETLDAAHVLPYRRILHIGDSFTDVPRSNLFYRFVENVFHHGVTAGCGGNWYCPADSVTRAQMAAFLLKAEHGAAFVPPPCTGVFEDVTCPSQFADWIEQLATEGITGGCGGSNYCPDNPVTRAQMAVFLLKAGHGSSYLPPPCNGMFADVACPSLFADWIEQLAAEQITGGCGGGNYCPNNPNTRGQMAVFLVKTFGLQLYGP